MMYTERQKIRNFIQINSHKLELLRKRNQTAVFHSTNILQETKNINAELKLITKHKGDMGQEVDHVIFNCT